MLYREKDDYVKWIETDIYQTVLTTKENEYILFWWETIFDKTIDVEQLRFLFKEKHNVELSRRKMYMTK